MKPLDDLYPELRIAFPRRLIKTEPEHFVDNIKAEIWITEWSDGSDDIDGEEKKIGYIEAFSVDVCGVADTGDFTLFEVMDAHSQSVADYLELFHNDDDEFSKTVHNSFPGMFGFDLLILDKIEIEKPYRGAGLGLLAIYELITAWGHDGLAAFQPFPLQFQGCFDSDWTPPPELIGKTPAQIDRARIKATRALGRYWRKLGARPIGKTGIYGISTALKTPEILRSIAGFEAPGKAAENLLDEVLDDYLSEAPPASDRVQ